MGNLLMHRYANALGGTAFITQRSVDDGPMRIVSLAKTHAMQDQPEELVVTMSACDLV